MRKAGIMRRYWIMFVSCWYTFLCSADILISYMLGFGTKQHIGMVIDIWARRLIGSINLSCDIYNPYGLKLNPDRPCIIMTNHSSLCDIPVCLFIFSGRIRMIAKKELKYVPIWNRAILKSGGLFVDRHNKRQVIKDLRSAKERLLNGTILWIAPEGTRSKNGELLPFKKGGFVLAQQVGAIIIPVGLRGVNKVLRSGSFDFHLNGKVEAHIGKPIDSLKYDNSQRSILMQDVKNSIGRAMGLDSDIDCGE